MGPLPSAPLSETATAVSTGDSHQPRPRIGSSDVPTAGSRVVARALALALDPSRDETAAVEELQALAGGDPTVLRLAWTDLVERSFGSASTAVLQAEYMLHQAIMRQLYRPTSASAFDTPSWERSDDHDGGAPVVA